MLGKAEIEAGVFTMCDMPATEYIEVALLKLHRMLHVVSREKALRSWAEERDILLSWGTALEFMKLSSEYLRDDLELLVEGKPLRQQEEKTWSWVTRRFGPTDEELLKLSTLVEHYDDSTREIVYTHMKRWSSSGDMQKEITLSMNKAQNTLDLVADTYKLQKKRTKEDVPQTMQLCPQYVQL